jgi:hypothetical protein
MYTGRVYIPDLLSACKETYSKRSAAIFAVALREGDSTTVACCYPYTPYNPYLT